MEGWRTHGVFDGFKVAYGLLAFGIDRSDPGPCLGAFVVAIDCDWGKALALTGEAANSVLQHGSFRRQGFDVHCDTPRLKKLIE